MSFSHGDVQFKLATRACDWLH